MAGCRLRPSRSYGRRGTRACAGIRRRVADVLARIARRVAGAHAGIRRRIVNVRSGNRCRAVATSRVVFRRAFEEAESSSDTRKWSGSFGLYAETQGDATPADLEAALWAEAERLQNEPVPADELAKVKNAVLANSFRRLQNPFFLLVQLLFYEGWGDPYYLNTSAQRTLAVTAEDVQRVAKRYFTKENRTVATYNRKAGTAAEPEPPLRLSLDLPLLAVAAAGYAVLAALLVGGATMLRGRAPSRAAEVAA